MKWSLLQIISVIVIFTFFVTNVELLAQIDTAVGYSLGYDKAKRLSFLYDEELDIRYDLPVQYPRGVAGTIKGLFVQVRSSDMYCLFDMKGKILMRESRRFRFDWDDRLIFANEMRTGQWFVLNFDGDTISYGRYPTFRYKISLKNKINIVESSSLDRKSRGFGFLNQKGEWLLKPISTLQPFITESEALIFAFNNEYRLKVEDLLNKRYDQVLDADGLLNSGAVQIQKSLDQKLSTSKVYAVESGGYSKDSLLEPREANYLGGIEKLVELFQNNFDLRHNTRKEIKKTIVLKVHISDDGSLKESKLLRGVDDAFNNELIRVFRLAQKWNPAIMIREESDMGHSFDLIYSSQEFYLLLFLDNEEEWHIQQQSTDFSIKEDKERWRRLQSIGE